MVPLTAAVMMVTGLIAMSETNRLITGALDPQARSSSLADVTGPLALADTEAWDTWALADLRAEVAAWIGLSAVFDLLFIAGYFLLVRQLVRHTRFARRALAGLVGTDLLESALLLVGAGALALGGVGWFRYVLAAVATVKWVLVAVLVTAVLRDDELRHRLWTMAVRIARALRVQRLSLLVVVVLAALAVVPSPGIFDQFPDVLRSWFQSVAWRGVRHGLCAAVATAAVAVQLFAIGRQRSERVWSSRVGGRPPSQPAQWRWWLGGLVVAVLAALALSLASGGRLVNWPTVGWVVAVPGVVLVASLIVQSQYGPRLWQERRRPRGAEEQRARDVWVAGDVLAMAVVLVGALALVRALVAPVLLGPAGSRGSTWLVRLLVLVAAAVLAVALVPLVDRWVRWLDSDDRPTGGSAWGEVVRFLRPSLPGGLSAPLRRGGVVALWVGGILGLLALMVFPVWLGDLLGVAATALFALGAWAFVLGLLIVHMQHRQPMAVFRLMKLRANPVLTLLLLTALLASLRGGDPQLHQLRTPPGEAPAVAPRDRLPLALDSWVERRQGCEVPAGTQDALPLVLVAASGGGIRAAYWTSGIMDQMKLAGGCAPSAVFLSSGVSGGSLGLALARGSTPMGDVRALTGSDALAAAVAGTLVGDVIAGTTGLRLPSYVSAEWAWRDRAGLMEEVWEEHARVLRDRWGPGDTGTSGILVLNSTAAGPGCRVLVSQVRVDGAPGAADGEPPEDTGGEPLSPACSAGTEQPPASFDLQQTYRRCTPDMTWATAAMLSARFPTVTPAARVPAADGRNKGEDAECAPAEDVQLIDGGYAEASGLGTLADVSAELMEAIRTHNAERAAGEPAVVPLVLYLEDETRTEIVEEPAELTPELFVPLVGRGAGAGQTTTGTWLQRLAETIAEPCAAADATGCAKAVQAVHREVEDGIVVAAPLTAPSVEAPLGWNLSWDSTTRLDDQAEHQRTACEFDPHPGGYACLQSLLRMLEP